MGRYRPTNERFARVERMLSARKEDFGANKCQHGKKTLAQINANTVC